MLLSFILFTLFILCVYLYVYIHDYFFFATPPTAFFATAPLPPLATTNPLMNRTISVRSYFSATINAVKPSLFLMGMDHDVMVASVRMMIVLWLFL